MSLFDMIFRFTLTFICWLPRAFFNVFLMCVNAVCSFIIALFINKLGYLPKFLKWFQTQDNPAIGDESYHTKEMAWVDPFLNKYLGFLPTSMLEWLSRYIRGIFWGIRNPAYGYSYLRGVKLSKPFQFYKEIGNPRIDIGKNETTGHAVYVLGACLILLTNGDGKRYFSFKLAFRYLFTNTGALIQFGYNLDPELKQDEQRRLMVDVRPFVSLA